MKWIIIIFLISILGLALAGFFVYRPDRQMVSDQSYKVGLVSYGGAHKDVIRGLKEGMSKLKYQEHVNIEYIEIDAGGVEEKVEEAGNTFIEENVDVVYTVSTPVTQIMMATIIDKPIVFNLVSDPVGVGIVQSLQSSQTNATGCSNAVGQTGPKRLEILKTILPNVQDVLVLFDPSNNFSSEAIIILRDASRDLSIQLHEKEIDSSDEIVSVMQSVKEGEYDAFFHLGEAKVSSVVQDVIKFANRVKLPTLAHAESFAEKGMLASYGPSWFDLGRQCATTMDKILKGSTPTDIPTQLPSRFDLVVNLDTARLLDIQLSREVQASVDRFIQ